MLTDVKMSEQNPAQRQLVEREDIVHRQIGEMKHTTDSLLAAQTSSPVPRSTRSAPASADSVAVNSSLPPQMIPAV